MANSALSVANLNFNDIKTNLQNYMQTQSSLKDYDFTGSNINVLLDVLAYNTYMQNFYLNMVANESFLNSAVLRDSIVSHAKTLNYLPQSRSSSKATIKLKINLWKSGFQVLPGLSVQLARIDFCKLQEFQVRARETRPHYESNHGLSLQIQLNIVRLQG